MMIRAHSFLQAMEFWAEPQNFSVFAEFRGIDTTGD